MNQRILAVVLLMGGCLLDDPSADDPSLDETSSDLLSQNKLSSNKLAANKLAANKLAANKLSASALPTNSSLINSADGREVLTYVVKCALGASTTVSIAATGGTVYQFTGEIGLAPAWATRVPTQSERHWVTACVMARTNFYGQSVPISLRGSHAALATIAAEVSAYSMDEGAFYGDMFAATPTFYACLSHKNYNDGAPSAGLRKCAVSTNGTTTDCGFTYTGYCHAAKQCTKDTTPYATCHTVKGSLASPTIAEVVTVFIQPN